MAAIEEELQRHGFARPSGTGKATRGWIHPELALGFEVVSGNLLDGIAERARVRLIDFGEDGEVSVIAVEDMIADRMGQYASGTAREMLEQAKRLRGGRVCLHRDWQRISGSSAGCFLDLPIWVVMQGGRSPTGVTAHIGGQVHAATFKGRLSKYA